MIRLLTKFDVRVDQKQLWKATNAVESSSEWAGYKLASEMVRLIFTTKELVISYGQGTRLKADVWPMLDAEPLEVLNGMIWLVLDFKPRWQYFSHFIVPGYYWGRKTPTTWNLFLLAQTSCWVEPQTLCKPTRRLPLVKIKFTTTGSNP